MQNLQDLSIYVLRELARRTGVSSPTSKRKEQLIDEIVAITDGKQKPNFSSKFGRPPKSFAYEIPNDIVVNKKDSKLVTFNQEKVKFSNKDMLSVQGYVQIINNISFLFVQNNNYNFIKCLIPATLTSNYKLKKGDKLVAELEEGKENSVVKEVYSINGFPILKMPNIKLDYENIPHVLPFKKIEFTNATLNSFNINCGENVFLYGNNNNQNTIACVEYLNSCSADVKIYINLSLVEKNKIFIKDLKQCDMLVSNLTDSVEYSKDVLAIAVERIKRALEFGYDVVVAVDDVLSLTAIDNEATLIKSLMSLTKASKKGSVSMFAVLNADSKISFVEKLADKRLKITNSEFELL